MDVVKSGAGAGVVVELGYDEMVAGEEGGARVKKSGALQGVIGAETSAL